MKGNVKTIIPGLVLSDRIISAIFLKYNDWNKLDIEIQISENLESSKSTQLNFFGVTKFDFILDDDLYYIVDFKFIYFEKSNEYYISFDPADNKKEMSFDDKDVIICKNFEVQN